MFIDVSMPIKSGAFFRYGIQPVEISRSVFHNDIEGNYEATVISMPAHTATHIDLVFQDRTVELERMIGRGKLLDVSGIYERPIKFEDINGNTIST